MCNNFQVVEGLDKQDASAALPQFTRLLTQAMDFRRLYASESTAQVCGDYMVIAAFRASRVTSSGVFKAFVSGEN